MATLRPCVTTVWGDKPSSTHTGSSSRRDNFSILCCISSLIENCKYDDTYKVMSSVMDSASPTICWQVLSSLYERQTAAECSYTKPSSSTSGSLCYVGAHRPCAPPAGHPLSHDRLPCDKVDGLGGWEATLWHIPGRSYGLAGPALRFRRGARLFSDALCNARAGPPIVSMTEQTVLTPSS